MRIMVTAGGTGGHIYPAVAIAEELLNREPESQLLYVGAEWGMEKKIIEQKKWRFAATKVKPFTRGSWFKMLAALFYLPLSLWQARRLIKKFRPDIIIGTGGYASFPLVLMGARMGIRTFIHEQNAYPGMTNRKLAPHADGVFLTFKEAAAYLPPCNFKVTGLPVRKEFLYTPKTPSKMPFDLTAGRFTLLVFGGSRGAEKINSAVRAMLPQYSVIDLQLIWVTGEREYDVIKAELAQMTSSVTYNTDIRLFPFLNNMNEAFSAADLAVCRAGAGTISELQVMGLPAILVPYPYAAAGHQEKNAQALEQQGGALLIPDQELSAGRLYQAIEDLRNSPQRLQKMRTSLQRYARPFALRDIADEIMNITKRH